MASRFYPRRCDSTPVRLKDQFLLDPDVVFLNHGSYGACPRSVLEEYQRWQRELEREPVEFLARRCGGLIAEARAALGDYPARGRPRVRRERDDRDERGRPPPGWGRGRGADDRPGVRRRRLHLGRDRGTNRAGAVRVALGPRHGGDARSVSHVARRRAILPVAELCSAGTRAGAARGGNGAHAPGHVPTTWWGSALMLFWQRTQMALCAEGCGFLWARPELQSALTRPSSAGAGRRRSSRSGTNGRGRATRPRSLRAGGDEFQREGLGRVRARCHALVEQFRRSAGFRRRRPSSARWSRSSCRPARSRRRRSAALRRPPDRGACFEHGGRPLLRFRRATTTKAMSSGYCSPCRKTLSAPDVARCPACGSGQSAADARLARDAPWQESNLRPAPEARPIP